LRTLNEQLGLNVRVSQGGYGQVLQELIAPGGPAGALRVWLVRANDFGADARAVERGLGEFAATLGAARARGDAGERVIVVCPETEYAAVAARLTQRLRALADVTVLDGAELAASAGVEDVYDAAGERLAHIPYTEMF